MNQTSWKDCGQGLSEYSLGIALVAVVSLGALTLLGGSLSDVFENLLPKDFKSPMAVATIPKPLAPEVIAPVPQQPATQTQTQIQTPGLPADGFSLKLSNGKTLAFPQYPKDMRKSIETLGANGTTSLLAGTLQALIKQLKDAGEITDAQAANLMAVANQGYKIAGMEKTVEGYIQDGADPDFRFKPPGEDDRTSIDAYLDHLGSRGDDDVELGDEMGILKSLKDKSLGGLTPDTAAMVEVLVAQIVDVGYGLETSVDWFRPDSDGTATTSTYLTAVFQNYNVGNPAWQREVDAKTLADLPTSASTITTANSAQICILGQHVNANGQCVSN